MKAPAARLQWLCTAAITAVALALLPAVASAGGSTTEVSGLTSQYKIEGPNPWNGTLVLYSHGYSFSPIAATDVGDATTGAWLLSNGYALAGSAYATSGWATKQAFEDQIAVLDVFAA